jgi:hypothetical protein
MADRTAAHLFGLIFEKLAEHPHEAHKEFAMQVYEMTREYDFSPYQMYADDACMALGIARKGVHHDYPEDGEVILWPNDRGWEKAQTD